MNDSVEGRLVAHIMEKKPNVTVTYYPAMIRIDGEDKLVFDMNEISEALGREMDPYTFQIEMSTHYGRMLIQDDAVELHADFEGTHEYVI
jgi:propane monooxygenase coupling protein